ncbi:unnamed protein product [Boreogadus saida]
MRQEDMILSANHFKVKHQHLAPCTFSRLGSQPSSTALTKSQAAAEHFPFCTIDPNESRVPIPHERCDFLCQFRGACQQRGAGLSNLPYDA